MEVGSKYSPPFIIMPVAVEPPIIIQPHDGAEIPAELTQSLQFTLSLIHISLPAPPARG